MTKSTLEEKGRALEDAFFREEGDPFREQLHVRELEAAAQEALADASGVTDAAVLARLASLGIRAETLAALTLIPLVEVAWADGRMEDEERRAVLSGAESTGIAADSPSHGLLRIWLEDRPAPDLIDAWRDYIQAICAELPTESRAHLRDRIVGRAHAVAAAAGGFLGVGSVSREEEAALAELEKAFAV